MKKFLINVLTFLIVMASTAGLVYLKKTDDYKKEVKKQSEQNQVEVVETDAGAELFFAAVSDVLSRGVDLRVRVNVGSIPVTADVKMTIEPFAVHADIVAFGQGITLDYTGDEVYVSANEMNFVADIEDAANAVELLTSAFALSLPSIENPLSGVDFSEVATKVTAPDLKIPYTDLGDGKTELALKLSDIGLDLSGLGLSTDFTAYLTVGGETGEEKFLSARLDKIALHDVPEISVSATFGVDEFVLPEVNTASYADLDAVLTQIAAFTDGGVQANFAVTASDISVTGALGYDVESGRAKLSAISGTHALSAVYAGSDVFVDYGNMKFAVSPDAAANVMKGLGVQLPSIPQIDFADIDVADIALKLLASQFKVEGDCHVVTTAIGGYEANVWFGRDGIEKIVVETEQFTLTLDHIAQCDSVALPEGEYYDIVALAQQGVDAYRYGATFDVAATYGDLSLSAAGKFRLDDTDVAVSAAVTAMEQTVDVIFDGEAVYLQTRGASALKAQISLTEIASLIPDGGMQLPEMATAVKTVLGMLPTIAMIAGENQTFTLSLTDVYGFDVNVVLSENGLAKITLTDEKDLSVVVEIGEVGTEQMPVSPLQPVDKDEYLPASELAQQVFGILENGIGFTVDATYDGMSATAIITAVDGAVYVAVEDMKFTVGMDWVMDTLKSLPLPEIDLKEMISALLDGAFGSATGGYSYTFEFLGVSVGLDFDGGTLRGIIVTVDGAEVAVNNIVAGESVSVPAGDYYNVENLVGQVCELVDGVTLNATAVVDGTTYQGITVTWYDSGLYVSLGEDELKFAVSVADIPEILTAMQSAFNFELPKAELDVASIVDKVLAATFNKVENNFVLTIADLFGITASITLDADGIASINATYGEYRVNLAVGSVVAPTTADYISVKNLALQVADIFDHGVEFAVDVSYDDIQATANITVVNNTVYVSVGEMKFTMTLAEIMERIGGAAELPALAITEILDTVLDGTFANGTYSIAVGDITASIVFAGGKLSTITANAYGAEVAVNNIVAGESVSVPAGDYYNVNNLIDQVIELIDGVTLNATAVVDGTTYQGITLTWYDGSVYVSLGDDELKFKVAISEIEEILTAMQSAFNFELPKTDLDITAIADKVLAATFNKVENNFVLGLNDLFGVDASITFDADGIASINATYGEYRATLGVNDVVAPTTADYISVKNLALQVADIFDHGASLAANVTYDGIDVTANITVVNNTVYVAIGEMKFTMTLAELMERVGGAAELPAMAITEILDTVLDGTFANGTYSIAVGDITASIAFVNGKLSTVTANAFGAEVAVNNIVAGESVSVPTGDYYNVNNLIDQVCELVDGVTLNATAVVDGTTYQGITLTWYNSGLYVSLGEDELKFKVAISEIEEILTAMQSAFNFELPKAEIDVASIIDKVLAATFNKVENNFVLTIADLFGITASITFDADGIASINATYGEYNANLAVGSVVAPTTADYISVKNLALQVADIFDHGASFAANVTYDGIQATANITVVNNTVYVAIGEMKFTMTLAELMERVGGAAELPALAITEILDTVLGGTFANGTYSVTVGDITASIAFVNGKLSTVTANAYGADVTVNNIVAGESVSVPAGDYYNVNNLIDQVCELVDGVTLNVTAVVDGTTYQGITVTWYDGSVYVSLGDDELKFAVSAADIPEILTAMQSAFNFELPKTDLDITAIVDKVLAATFNKVENNFVLTIADLFGITASITFDADGIASINATYGEYNATLGVNDVVAPTVADYISVKNLALQVADIFDHGASFAANVTYDGIDVTANMTVVNNTVYVAIGEMKFTMTLAEIMERVGSAVELPAIAIAEIVDVIFDGFYGVRDYKHFNIVVENYSITASFGDNGIELLTLGNEKGVLMISRIVAGESVNVPAGDYYNVNNLIDQVFELINGVTLNATAVVDGTTYQGITVTWYDGSVYVSLGDDELKFAVSAADIPEILTAMQSAFNFELPKTDLDITAIVDKVLAATFNKVENNFVLTIADLFGITASITFDADGIASVGVTYGEYNANLAVGSVVAPTTADYISVKNLAFQVADIFDHGVSLAANVTYDGMSATANVTIVNNTVYVTIGEMKFTMTLAEIMERVGGAGMPAMAITEILDTVLDGTFANGTYSIAVGDITASVTFAGGKLSTVTANAYGADVTVNNIVAGESVSVPAGDYYNVNNLIDQVFDAMGGGLTFSIGATYHEVSLSASGSFRLEGNQPTASAVVTVYDRTIAVYFDGTTVFVALGENGFKAKLTVSEIPSILASFGVASGAGELSLANIVEKVLAATFNKVENNFVLTVDDLFGANVSIALNADGVVGVTAGLSGVSANVTVLTGGNREQPVAVGTVGDAQAYLDASGIAQTAADVLDGGVTTSISATYQGRTLSGTVTYDLRGAVNVKLAYGEHNLVAVYENGTLYVIADNLKLSLSKDKVLEVLSTFGIELPSGDQSATESIDVQSIVQKVIDATFVKMDSAFNWSTTIEGFTITLTLTNDGQLRASVTSADLAASLTSVTAGGTVASPTEAYYNANHLADQVIKAYQNGIETSFDVNAMGYALSGSVAARYQDGKMGAVLTIDTISRLADDGTVAYTHAQPITVTFADGTIYVAVGENGLKVKLTVEQIQELIPAAAQADEGEGIDLESIVLQVISATFEGKQDGSYVLTVLDLMGIDLTLTFGGSGITAIGAIYGEITAGLSEVLSATENSAVSMPTVGNAADYVDGADLITQVTDIAGGGMTAQVNATLAGNEISGSVQISVENGIAVRANLTFTRDGQTVTLEVHYANEKIYVSVPTTGLKLVATQADIQTLISDVTEIASFFAMSIAVGEGGVTTTTDELIDGVMNGTQQTVTGGYLLSLSLLGFDLGITFDHSGILQITVAQKEINATLSGVSANSGNFDGTVAGESEYTSLSAITAMTGGMLATMNKKAFAITDSVVKLPGITANINYLNIQLAEEAGKNFFETLGDRLMEIDADLSVTMGSKTHTLKLWYEYVAGATSGDGKTLFIEFDTLKLKMADSSMFGIIASVCQLMGQPLPDFLLEFLEDPENSDIFNQGGIGGGGEDKPLDIDIPALLNMFVSLSFEQNGSANLVLDGNSKMLSSLNLKDNLSISVTMVTGADGVTTLGGITASDGTAQTLNADLTLSAQSTVALDVLTLDESKAYVDITPIKQLLDSFLGTANKPDRATPSSTVKLATGETATTKNFYIEGDLKMSMKVIVGSINVNIKLYADILLTTIRDGNGNFLRQEVEAYIRSENDRTYLLGYGVFKGTGEIYYDNSIKENVNGQQKSVLYLSRNQDEKTSSWGSAKNKQYRKRIDMSYLGNTENAIRTIGLFFGMTDSMQKAIIDGVANANYTTDLTKLFAPLQQFDGQDGRPSDINGNTQFYGYQPASSSSAGGHEIAINTFALTGEDMLKDLSILFGISHDNATNTDYIGSLNMKYYIELLGSGVTCTITTPNGGFKHTIGGTCPSSKTSCEGFGVWFTDQGGKGNFTEAVQYIA